MTGNALFLHVKRQHSVGATCPPGAIRVDPNHRPRRVGGSGHPRIMKVYKPHERPEVEVLVDGTWYRGELRGTWRRGGVDVCNVSWRERPGMIRLDTVAAERVRLI